jgi:putative endopeptidase
MLSKLNILLLSGILFISCGGHKMTSGVDTKDFDPSVKPQADFYRYVNGGWLERTKIPADKSNYGAFNILIDKTEENLRKIIEGTASMPDKKEGSDEQKVGDFYSSFMDTVRIEKLGLQPLQEELGRIAAISSRNDLVGQFAHNHQLGVKTSINYYVDVDEKKSDQYISYIYQSGLGLPDRDYYFKEDPKFQDIRKKYVDHIVTMLTLAGIDDPAGKANRIFALEKKLAGVQWTRVENRDRDKTYNKYSIKQLVDLTPQFDWSLFLSMAGAGDIQDIVVNQPSYVEGFDAIYARHDVDDWKDYLTWQLLNKYAPMLSQKFVDADFEFYGKTLSGIEVNKPRWKRAVNAIDDVIGELVGKVYVKEYFKPEAKQRMVNLVNNVTEALKHRIENLTWMGPETKAKALQKLAKFHAKIGYPDKWKDYSKLSIAKDDLVGNYFRAYDFELKRMINKLGKPVDRTEWFMTPQTVNAYYNPTMNEIVFPAAILQPPFFNMKADDAVNYGAIGAVIGHEITHGFDDQGRKSDGDGNLVDWWTKDDEKEFMKRAQVIVDQYDHYTPVDTMHVNGELTLGENIADLGGVTIAYDAYKLALNGKEAPVIDGFTCDQRLFIGWAQVWRCKYRDEELRRRLLIDPHSPTEYRVIGVLSNLPQFYSAFHVTENDPMYRPEQKRALIW